MFNLEPIQAMAIHQFFEALGLSLGALLYRSRRAPGVGLLQAPDFWVLAGCLLGAGLGNKLAFWLQRPDLWQQVPFWSGGQSMVGGLVGGWLGVELAKKCLGVRLSTGDAFVIPLCVGIVLGRIGCLIAGLHDDTYGLPTLLPWGINFGDGEYRHPTQIYEMIFVLLLAIGAHRLSSKQHLPAGAIFCAFMCSYLIWRLAIDSLKPLPPVHFLQISGIQWLCLVTLVIYLPLSVWRFRRWLARVGGE